MSKKQKTSTSEVEKRNVDDLPSAITYEVLDKMMGDCKKIIEYLSLNKNRIQRLQITKAQFEKLTKERILSEAFDNLEKKEAEDVRYEGTYSLKKWPHIEKFVKDPEIQQAANKFYTKCLFKYLYDKYEGKTMKHKWYDAIKKNSIRKDLLDDKINRVKDTLTKIKEKKNNVIKHKKEMFVLSTLKIEVDQIKTDVDKIEQVEQDIQNFQYFTDITEIAPGAMRMRDYKMRFQMGDNIKTLVIPDTVTEISWNAFEYAPLQAIHLPKSLTMIGDSAFAESTLQSITIPDSVHTIGKRAFLNANIKKIKLSKSLKIIPDEFCNTCGLEDLEIPNSVTEINKWSFYHNNIKEITIGNNVKDIGFKAFAKNKIKTLTISNSVADIGSYAFYDNEINKLTIPNNVKFINSAAFFKNKIKTLALGSGVTRIRKLTFAKNNLVSLVIPFNVDFIGIKAFYFNEIETLIIQNGVTTIESKAFAKNKITSVILPGSLTKLAEDAFDSTVNIIKDGGWAGVVMTGSLNSLQLKL